MGMIRHTGGFTIIETMLFLAITAALAIGILLGTGTAINQQRYQDAVNSLKSYMQDQFSRVATVTNDRAGDLSCDSVAQVSEGTGGQYRGTSDCLLLGRLVTVDGSGQNLSATNIVGYRPAGKEQTSDIAELQTYLYGFSPIDTDKQQVSWGATIVQPKKTSPQPASLLIIRSPLSGRILSFSTTHEVTNVTDLKAQINVANMAQPLLLCVQPSGGTVASQPLGVQIDAAAAGQSGVEIPMGNAGVCG